MNYNIDTSQGMRNAVGWMEQMLGECRTPTLIWMIPRSGATYTIHITEKNYSSVATDEPTERVLQHMGFKKVTLQ